MITVTKTDLGFSVHIPGTKMKPMVYESREGAEIAAKAAAWRKGVPARFVESDGSEVSIEQEYDAVDSR